LQDVNKTGPEALPVSVV